MQNIPMEMALQILELPIDSCDIRSGMPVGMVKERFEVFKDLVRKQKKVLAKKYHPDLNDGNDERMKEINNLVDMIMEMEIKAVNAPVVRYYRYTYDAGSASTTTSYTAGMG